jgi:hypothetical protein
MEACTASFMICVTSGYFIFSVSRSAEQLRVYFAQPGKHVFSGILERIYSDHYRSTLEFDPRVPHFLVTYKDAKRCKRCT